MFTSLEIQNFQSHKDTYISFHPGFNSIIGSTDSGKSAIYRSIYWLRFNKAADFISFWNRKKDGTPIDPSFSCIKTDEAIIKRERSHELNGYRIDDQDPLAAIGRGEPPESVVKLLNISDINFFSQHNPPFLLTKSAGEVATMLNDLIHLSDIDRVLSNIDKLKRANKKELEQYTDLSASLEKDINSYSWVEQTEQLLEVANGIEIEYKEIKEKYSSIYSSYSQCIDFNEFVQSNEDIVSKALPFIEKIDTIDKELEELMLRYSEIERVASAIKKIEESVEILKKLDVSDEIAKYDSIQNELDSVTDSISDFTNWVTMYTSKSTIIGRTEAELKEAQAELSAIPVCSECGSPLEDCDDSDR